MSETYIVECVRSPIGIGKKGGALHNVHPVNLLAKVLDELAKRAQIDKSLIEDVICGCVTPIRQQGANIPRIALLKAGYPVHVPGVQLNRMCGSGQQAVHFASQAVASGDMDLVIGCGIEMMSVVQMGSDATKDVFTFDLDNEQKFSFGSFPYKLVHQGISAELIAEKYKITRKEMEDFATESHRKCAEAIKNGHFDSQIVKIPVVDKDGNKKLFSRDEGVRYPVNRQKMSSLRPVFKKNGVITAALASQVSDGAGAVLIASEAACQKYGLKKRARIVARVVVGSDPLMMLDGVIPSTRKCLEKAGLTVDDIDVFEINEAFASVVLAWQKTLKIPMEKINPNGGAIAHGHPLGATGAILMTKLVNELERSNKRYGLQTMCIGHGQATTTIIENLSYKPKSRL